jgi:hypothetical protein
MFKLIIQNGVAGRGVFAGETIPAGSEILDFTGPLLRYEQTSPDTLAVQIGPDLYLGASGGMDDLVNHSCDPNSGLRIDGTNVQLIALRDIAVGEELCFDYSTTMDEDDFEMPCHCGRPQCRGLIRDFSHLPAELKRRYARLGVTPNYNLRYVE